ncbi:unnamed protein product [Pedinophyceae sp. YPF-701]|nr:unnamed protein product [Pedinophyceae sp. YPF-701]
MREAAHIVAEHAYPPRSLEQAARKRDCTEGVSKPLGAAGDGTGASDGRGGCKSAVPPARISTLDLPRTQNTEPLQSARHAGGGPSAPPRTAWAVGGSEAGQPAAPLGPPASPGRVAALEREMRATLGSMASFNEDEKALLLRAFRLRERSLRQRGIFQPPGLATERDFRKVWATFSVEVSREDVVALFQRYGCDREGRLPYDVFAQTMFGSRTRLIGLEPSHKGPFKAGEDYSFRGQFKYRFCRKAVYTPTDWDGALGARSAELPGPGLELEHVHGYAGIDGTASNLFYNKAGHAVYYCAGVAVVHDKDENRQRFFLEHNDDIKCLAMHPDRVLAATGQVTPKYGAPCVLVWDTTGAPPETRQRIDFPTEEGYGYRQIVAVQFSPCGQRLVVVTGDDRHTVHVFEWASGALLFEGIGHNGAPPQVFGAVWNPFPRESFLDPALPATGTLSKAPAAGPDMFVTYGVKHLKIWIRGPDGKGRETYASQHGKFGKARVGDVLSACFLPRGLLATGTQSGAILLWDMGATNTPHSFGCCVRIEAAHSPGPKARSPFDGQLTLQGVRGLVVRKGCSELVSGGSDGQLIVWDLLGGRLGLGRPMKGIRLDDVGDKMVPSVRSLDAHPVSGSLLVGTSACDVLEVPGDGDEAPAPLVDGHRADLHHVAFHPKRGHKYATACESGVVSFWDARRRQLLAKVNIGLPACAVDFSPNGLHLAIGCGEGSVRVLATSDLRKTLKAARHCIEAIHEVRYSPDGAKLAVGSHDNFVDVYDVERGYARLARFAGHSSYVTHIDWSADSRVVMSNCGAYELLYFDAATGRQVKGSQRDTRWASWTSVLGFPVMGVWRTGEDDTYDGTDINALCRSVLAPPGGRDAGESARVVPQPDTLAGQGAVVVTASDDGMVRMLNYPCVVENAPAREYRGHSSHVTCARFSPNNGWVVTTGGHDRAVFQWRVLPRADPQAKRRSLGPNAVWERPERMLVEPSVPIPGDDGAAAKRERKLPGPRHKMERGEAEYDIKVYTSDIRGAGTDANVFCMIYGEHGQTMELRLDNNKNNFERGREDVFTVKARDVGKPAKLRIGHDNSGMGPGWHLDRVEVRNRGEGPTAPLVTFQCGRWLATDEDDRQIVRVLAADGSGVKACKYRVVVHTSDIKGAGTDANVFLTLYGEGDDGSFGPVRLDNSKNNFERNMEDVFEVECMVQDIKYIRIGHDGSGLGPAWHLNDVIISCPGKPTLTFDADQWLPEEDGGDTYVVLSPEGRDKPPVHTYKVEVFTTDMRGAGTDANVHLVMFGENGRQMGPTPLDTSKNNFERGAHDIFLLKSPDLGALHEIEIGHDNKGLGPGWHLSQVVITNTTTQARYNFPCHQWFDRKEGDGLTRRRLQASDADSAMTTYTVTVVTSDLRGAGTDAGVYMEMHGKDKDGGEVVVPRQTLDTSKNNFERAQVDVFILPQMPNTAELTHVIVGHDNKGLGPGWHLDHVEVVNEATGLRQYFDCRKWFDKKEDDGLIERKLDASKGSAGFDDMVPYRIVVQTSDVKGAGTDADVEVELFGKIEKDGRLVARSSGKQKLDNGGKNNFERGQRDAFTIVCPNLGKLDRMWIGHNNKGLGPGWHLANVEVTSVSTGTHYVFPAYRWLDTKETPYSTDALLYPEGSDEAATRPHRYRIVTHTSDIRGAGTDAGVSAQIHGTEGVTRSMSLHTRGNPFERGNRDEFVIEAANVGEMQKLTIGHDNRGLASAWHLSHVEVDDLTTGQRCMFFYGGWLDKTNGLQVTLEPTGDVGAEQPRRYHVRCKTADKRGAGTDKDVTAFLVGEDGTRSEALALEKSKNDFERGQLDEFLVELPPGTELGELKEVDIGFAEKQSVAGALGALTGMAWGLEYVEVVDMQSNVTYFFPNRHGWLDKKQQRVVLPRGLPGEEAKARFKVVVTTSDIRGAGTDANVALNLFGEHEDGTKAVSGPLPLDSGRRNDFERGHKDEFSVESVPLGEIVRAELSKDESGLGSAWHCESVEVTDLQTSQVYFFPCGKWLDGKKDPNSLTQVLLPEGKAGEVLYDYVVTVYTSDIRGAGTDSDVTMELRGTQAMFGPRRLDSSENDFERGRKDVFHVEGPDVGDVEELVMATNNKGMGAAWHLDSVEVFHPLQKKSYFFVCKDWLKYDKTTKMDGCRKVLKPGEGPSGDKKRYRVVTTTSDLRGAGTDSDIFVTVYGDKGDTGERALDAGKEAFERGNQDTFFVDARDIGKVQRLKVRSNGKGMGGAWHLSTVEVTDLAEGAATLFSYRDWIDKKKGLTQELLPDTDGDGAGDDVGARGRKDYDVRVYTSDKRGAGTDADVHVSLKGDWGFIGESMLPAKGKAFQRNKRDEFTISGTDCGTLQELGVRIEGGGSWHLRQIEVLDKATGELYAFPCDEEFDDETPQRTLKEGRVLAAEAAEAAAADPQQQYRVQVWTGAAGGAGTDDDVLVTVVDAEGNVLGGEAQNLDDNKNNFEKGREDNFFISVPESKGLRAPVAKLVVEKKKRGMSLGGDWQLDRIAVLDVARGQQLLWKAQGAWEGWFGTKHGVVHAWEVDKHLQGADQDLELVAGAEHVGGPRGAAQAPESQHEGIEDKYRIAVTTTKKMGAGTDAEVFAELEGENGQRWEPVLEQRKEHFESGKTDEFFADTDVGLGELRNLRLWHSGKGLLAGWHCDNVVVERLNTGEAWQFDCKSDVPKAKSASQAGKVIPAKKIREARATEEEPPPPVKAESPAESPAESERPRITRRESVAFGMAEPDPDADPGEYEIVFKTGTREDAGTDAHVECQVYGERGGFQPMLDQIKLSFDQGCEDTFVVKSDWGDLGELVQANLWHDGSNESPDWWLAWLSVRHLRSGRIWRFPCGKWVKEGPDDPTVLFPMGDRLETVRSTVRRQSMALRATQTEQEQDAAATKIQAAFRGRRDRKRVTDMRRDKAEEDARRDAAATTIQAGYRGHRDRNSVAAVRADADAERQRAAEDAEEARRGAEEAAEVQRQNEAATKIQAVYRGNRDRKVAAERQAAPPQAPPPREVQEQAAAKIQAAFRGQRDRKRAESRRQRRAEGRYEGSDDSFSQFSRDTWEEHFQEVEGVQVPYYFNIMTGESTWERPPGFD